MSRKEYERLATGGDDGNVVDDDKVKGFPLASRQVHIHSIDQYYIHTLSKSSMNPRLMNDKSFNRHFSFKEDFYAERNHGVTSK
jgi:hypothetical protein